MTHNNTNEKSQTNRTPAELAVGYLAAVASHDVDRVAAFLAPDVSLIGPTATRRGAGEVLAAFKRLGAIHVKNEITRVFADGDEVCVIYDFVTDTPAGALATIEWLGFDDDGKIRTIHLYYDRVPWKVALDEMATRNAGNAAADNGKRPSA